MPSSRWRPKGGIWVIENEDCRWWVSNEKKAFALWDCTGHQPPPFALSAGHLGYSCIPEVPKNSRAALVACKQTPRTRPPSQGWAYYDSLDPVSDEPAQKKSAVHNEILSQLWLATRVGRVGCRFGISVKHYLVSDPRNTNILKCKDFHLWCVI